MLDGPGGTGCNVPVHVLIDSFHYARTFSLEFLAESFRCHVDHFQMLDGPGRTGCNISVLPEPSSIQNDAHVIENLLLNTQVS